MKKSFYYLLPFILLAVFVFGYEYLGKLEIIPRSPYILYIGLAVISIFMGLISPSKKKFDILMAVIVPLSFLIVMFIAGFLDKDDIETRFHIDRAFRVVYQNWALISYCLMGALTFLSSYKKIRIRKKYRS